MQKKPAKNENQQDLNDDDLNDDLLDEDWMTDDLDDDPLLQEAANLLGVPVEQSQVEKPEKKVDVKKKSVPKQTRSQKTTTEQKPIINKATLTEFANLLMKYENIYEEISFRTLIRKLPQKWNYTEDVLIDVLEVLIGNHTIPSFDMKMTQNSVKFYPLGSKQDIPKKKKK